MPPSGPPGIPWQQSIWEILMREGRPDVDDEDAPVVFLNSYYLDHVRHPHQDQSRPLRFSWDFHNWEADIRFVWEDFIDPNLGLEVHLVQPQYNRSHLPSRTVALALQSLYIRTPLNLKLHASSLLLSSRTPPRECKNRRTRLGLICTLIVLFVLAELMIYVPSVIEMDMILALFMWVFAFFLEIKPFPLMMD